MCSCVPGVVLQAVVLRCCSVAGSGVVVLQIVVCSVVVLQAMVL